MYCGTHCQPTEIQVEIQLFDTSTRPARVGTDAGEGFIKGVGNPQGESALISELIAAELGTWFGLKIPPFAVVNLCQIEIPMMGHHGNILPPMFFSSAVDGMPRDGGDTFLKRLSNKSDVARLVIFDTWIRNNDRYVDGSPNSDNLLYATAQKGRTYDLVPIDHSHCFVDDSFEDLPDEDLIEDDIVYGRYPEFEGFITPKAVSDALSDLKSLDRDFVEQCVNSVPPLWGLGIVASEHLVEFICRRANFVVESINIKLVNDPMMPGL